MCKWLAHREGSNSAYFRHDILMFQQYHAVQAGIASNLSVLLQFMPRNMETKLVYVDAGPSRSECWSIRQSRISISADGITEPHHILLTSGLKLRIGAA